MGTSSEGKPNIEVQNFKSKDISRLIDIGTHPFDNSVDKPADIYGNGTVSTEITGTAQDANGKWFNYPTLWWRDGKPILLGDESAQQAAIAYEKATGKKFPRFKTEKEANDWAIKRSHGGGAEQGPLAK